MEQKLNLMFFKIFCIDLKIWIFLFKINFKNSQINYAKKKKKPTVRKQIPFIQKPKKQKPSNTIYTYFIKHLWRDWLRIVIGCDNAQS